MSDMGGKVAVVGLSSSKVYRRDDVPLGKLAVDACNSAIEDAGLKASDIDGVACAPNQPFDGSGNVEGIDLVNPGFIIHALGLDVGWTETVQGMVGNSLIEAINSVGAGSCNYALVFRALHNPKGRYGNTNPTGAGGAGQFTGPYGQYAPAMFAHLQQRYMDKYGATREQMATFVVNNRKNANIWEYGYWYQLQQGLTVEDYLESRMISAPICIHDCDIPVQGCGAFVVTTAERAKDLKHPPAYVLGTSCPRGTSRNLTLEDCMESGAHNAKHLWKNSGVGPKDVDVANVYDGFSIITPMWLECLGFCGEGEAFEFMQGGRIAIDGEFPLNTSSGNLGTGRLHGVPHLMDAAFQVMGRSGPRQVKNAEISIAAVGPVSGGSTMIFSKTPR